MAGLITTVVAALIIVGVLGFVILSGDTHAEVEIDGDTLRLLPVGKAKILAFRSNRAVPLSSVRGVETVDNIRALGIGLRIGGSSFPGIVYAGHFWSPKNGRMAAGTPARRLAPVVPAPP